MNRRKFFRNSAASGGALFLGAIESAARPDEPSLTPSGRLHLEAGPVHSARLPRLPDLNPARWLWYPSARCLQNTFVFFRRELNLTQSVRRATGWIAADSRYLLEINGQRVQWGPAPADPRWAEADPVDLSHSLNLGKNIIGVTVLYYGQGDGTWPIGKPGFLFWLDLEYADGRTEKLVSDPSWKSYLARAWKPGHYKRWYLRALRREAITALFLGAVCGLIVGLVVLAWRGEGMPAVVIGLSVAVSLCAACLAGLSVPALLHALKLDPKIAAGPVTLALTDIFTLLFYFSLARFLL